MAEEIGIVVNIVPYIDPKFDWNQTLKASLPKEGLKIQIDTLSADTAIQKLKQNIKQQLSKIEIGVQYTAKASSGGSIKSTSKGMRSMAGELDAAQRMADSFKTSYSNMLRTMAGTGNTVNASLKPIDNMVKQYAKLEQASVRASNVEGQTASGYIQSVEQYANAYGESEKQASKYVAAVQQLSNAQETYNKARESGYGGTSQAQALKTQMESLSGIVTQVSNGSGQIGQQMAISLGVATDAAKQAEKALIKVTKSETTDMSGVTESLQRVNTMLTSGDITSSKSIESLQNLKTALQDIQASGQVVPSTLDNINKQMDKLQPTNMTDSLRTAQTMTESLLNSYDSVIKAAGKAGVSEDVGPIKQLESAYNDLSVAVGNAYKDENIQTSEQWNQAVEKESAAVKQACDNYNVYKQALKQVKTSTQNVNTAMDKGFGNTEQVQAATQQINQLNDSLKAVEDAGGTATQQLYDNLQRDAEATSKVTKQVNKMANSWSTDMQPVTNTMNQLNTLMSAGFNFNEQTTQQLKGFQQELSKMTAQGGYDPKQLDKIASSIKKIGTEAQASQKGIKGLVTQLKNMATSMLTSMAIRQAFQLISKGVTSVISTVKELDSAMTQLEIVTGASTTELQQFFDAAAGSAKAYGASITDIVGSMETFARLGYNLQDALNLTNTATIMSNVAATSVDEATTGLTSIVKAYGIEASEAEGVADELVAVGQSYAISAEELMTAFEKGGSSLAAANNTIEESIALFAAGNASVQNAANVGTALKTTSARIRSATAELDQMGEEYDDLVASASDYREEIMALSGVDIMQSED